MSAAQMPLVGPVLMELAVVCIVSDLATMAGSNARRIQQDPQGANVCGLHYAA